MTGTTEGAGAGDGDGDAAAGLDVATAAKAVEGMLAELGLEGEEDAPSEADRKSQEAAQETPEEGEADPKPKPDQVDKPSKAEASEEPEGEPDEGDEVGFDPPVSWSADEKDVFGTLAPEVQEVISRRDMEREQAFKNNKASLETKSKAHEDAVTEATGQFTERFALLDTIFGDMEKAFFNGVGPGTEEDLDKDPEDYMRKNARFTARQHQWDNLKQQIGEQREIAATNLQKQIKDGADKEYALRLEIWPEWGDSKRATAIASELDSYLEEKGFRPEERSALIDHRLFNILRDALSHHKIKATRKSVTRRVAATPRIQKPGTTRRGENTSKAREAKSRERMRRTGKRQDAQDWIEKHVL